jgi:hypothetical protein
VRQSLRKLRSTFPPVTPQPPGLPEAG